MPAPSYHPHALTADAVSALPGAVVLDFGTEWCGHCAAARERVDAALAAHPEITHLRLEDGKGRALGRAFGIKLWPTLVFLRDGQERARCVRPQDDGVIAQALAQIALKD